MVSCDLGNGADVMTFGSLPVSPMAPVGARCERIDE
jgi:hypothetical protein